MKKYILMAAASLVLSGCGDFLEPDSPSEFVPKDVDSFNELLLGEAYLRNDASSGVNIFLNLMEDDIDAAPYQNPESGFQADKYLAAFAWNPTMYKMMEEAGFPKTNIYYNYYSYILGCNAVLDYVVEDDVIGTPEKKAYVMAQAYALRGFYYLNLVNIFGQPYNEQPDALGVPLKIQSGIEEGENALARKPVKAVYDQILADLLKSEELYSTLTPEFQWDRNYRTSLPMVHLLLSRTYLYMEEWEKAAEYAKKVMDNRQFSLIDLNTIPVKGKNSEGDSINVYTDFHAYSSPEAIWLYGEMGDMFKIVSDNSTQNEKGEPLHSYFRASESLMKTYEKNDLRVDRYIVHVGIDKLDAEGNEVFLPMPYGKVHVGETSYRPVAGAGSGVFARSLRLSEAYLNYCEAEAMMAKAGNAAGQAAAISALNQLRKNRFAPADFVPVSVASADELVQFIRDERRRELCFEGLRWYDLRRWGMKEIKHVWYPNANEKTTYTLTEKDLMFAVPIPDEAMGYNAVLEQNKLPNFNKRVGETKNVIK